MSFTPDADLASEHRRWLKASDAQYLANWESLLSSDPEAAMAEAAVRRLLQENGNTVKPNGHPDGLTASPDFYCTQYGQAFLVETACISIAKMTQATKQVQLPEASAEAWLAQVNEAIFQAVRQKTRECVRQEQPVLVAVCSYHPQASSVCFHRDHLEMLLTPEATRAWNVATRNTAGDARNPVSGLLLCGLGCELAEARGILHPAPVHHFDRSLLPKVEFGRLREGYREPGRPSTEWV